MMPRGKDVRRITPILQIICIVLLLAFLTIILTLEVMRVGEDMTLVRADTKTLSFTLSGTGYLFGTETPLPAVDGETVCFHMADGQPVAAGDSPVSVYPLGQRADAPAIATSISDQLVFLSSLAQEDTPWQADYLTAYAAWMSQYGNAGIDDYSNETAAVLAAIMAGEASVETLSARIAKLEAALSELLADVSAQVMRPMVEQDGYFVRHTDGYEGVFNPMWLAELTPGRLFAPLQSSQGTPSKGGKVVSGPVYLVMPVAAEEAAGMEKDRIYTLQMAEGTVPMRLTALSLPDADGRVLLTFMTEETHLLARGTRRREVKVTLREETGICVPMAAVSKEDDRLFVYVAKEGRAMRRYLETSVCDEGYCLAKASTLDGYLREGEEIILTARRIYEGKVLRLP